MTIEEQRKVSCYEKQYSIVKFLYTCNHRRFYVEKERVKFLHNCCPVDVKTNKLDKKYNEWVLDNFSIFFYIALLHKGDRSLIVKRWGPDGINA